MQANARNDHSKHDAREERLMASARPFPPTLSKRDKQGTEKCH